MPGPVKNSCHSSLRRVLWGNPLILLWRTQKAFSAARPRDELPVALPDCLLKSPFEEFPIKVVVSPLLFSQKRGHDGNTVQAGRSTHARQFSSRRQEVPESPRELAYLSRRDGLRPSGDGRDPDSTFVEVALHAPQRSGTAEEAGVVSSLFMWSVVAAENDQRILVQALPLQELENAADIGIHSRNDGREVLIDIGPVLATIHSLIRRVDPVLLQQPEFVIGVWNRIGQVEEEWISLLPFNEGKRPRAE